MGRELIKEWITEAGLKARVYRVDHGGPSWLCGYVRVPPNHPLHGVGYAEPTLAIQPEWILEQEIGKRSPVTIFTAGVKALHGEEVARTPELLFNVYGSLTWSGTMPDDPEGWWFGFDSAHPGEELSVSDMIEECESLASQIVRWFPDVQV